MERNDKSFYGLGISPGILQIIEKIGLQTPTPIQKQSIPVAIEGKDIMGIAQTGTGKTLAYGIPLAQHLLQRDGLALVIVPTRELALQVREALGKIAVPLGLSGATLIGGEPINRQIRELSRRPQIIIGTPGRVIDLLEQRKLNLQRVTVLVLDEADRMLDMGFAPQLKKIEQVLPKNRQTLLFSATMPEEIIKIARAYLKLPIRVEIAKSGTTAKDVTHELFFVEQGGKPKLLEKVLFEYKGSVLVFTRLKFGAKRIATHLRHLGYTAAEIHSNRSLNQRREALDGFKRGKYRILVATDIAARGIDVNNIELVINFDLPENPEDYVHRIGRTGRAGERGHAISFARPNQKEDVRAIERLIRFAIPVSQLPALNTGETYEAPAKQKSFFDPSAVRPGFRRERKQRSGFPGRKNSSSFRNRRGR